MAHLSSVYFTYCDSPTVLWVSATGPTAARTSVGPFTHHDAIAPYTNFGRSAISLAAPGGGITTPNAFVTGPCSQTSLAWHQPPRPSPGAPLPPPVIDGPLCPRNLGLFLLRGAGTSCPSANDAAAAAALVPPIGHGNPSPVPRGLNNTAR